MTPVDREAMKTLLTGKYGEREDHAVRILEICDWIGFSTFPHPRGFLRVDQIERGKFILTEHFVSRKSGDRT